MLENQIEEHNEEIENLTSMNEELNDFVNKVKTNMSSIFPGNGNKEYKIRC